ncbi:MAG: amidohydrolase family protein [Abditibacteriota bacterium]|nr:amidohydrolase family protein [Abditibacteriota bacterium]
MKIIDVNTVYGPYTGAAADNDAGALEKRLAEDGVSKAFSLSSYGIYYSYRDGNARTLKACSESPVLLPAATIDPRGWFGQKELLPKLKEAGFGLLRFFPDLQEWEPEHLVFEELLRLNSEVRLPVMISVTAPGQITRVFRIAGRLEYPVILQGIGYLQLAETISAVRQSRSFMVETSGLSMPATLELLYNCVGPDRILFGSGACERSAGIARDFVLASHIPDEGKEQILYKNSVSVLGAEA